MQSPQPHLLSGDQILLRPKSGRTPLKPLNSPVTTPATKAKPTPQEFIKICDKENRPPICAAVQVVETATTVDVSLAEELIAIRKKLERLRLDRKRTEKMLKEKDSVLDLQMKEVETRGQIQKMLEIDVDRVFRLNQLHSQSIQFSPIRSLREREQQKKANESSPFKIVITEAEMEESVGENTPQKLSSPSSNSEIVTSSDTAAIV